MGLRALLVKWCMTGLLSIAVVDSISFFVVFLRAWAKLKHGKEVLMEAKLYIACFNSSYPLRAVLGVIKSHALLLTGHPPPPCPPFPPSKTLKFSCTCRTWRPCLKAARLSGSDPRSRGWLGAPSPEEHSRERRTLRGSRCCTGSAAVKGRWQKRWGLASTFPNTKTDSRSGTFSHRAVGGVCTA